MASTRFCLCFLAAIFLSAPIAYGQDSHSFPYTSVNLLVPFDDNGPGVVVCDPITSENSAITNFGLGCAAWLELNVAGRPEFGRSPGMSELGRISQELHLPGLALSVSNAQNLAGIVGATDVIVGSFDGTPAQCTLTYQDYRVPMGQARGPALTISGSESQIAAQLPHLAREMITILDGSKQSVPPIGMTAGDLTIAGALSHEYNSRNVTDANIRRLRDVSKHSLLASLIYLRYVAGISDSETKAGVHRILAMGPKNLIAVNEAAWTGNNDLVRHSDVIRKNYGSFPHNYLACLAAVWLARSVADDAFEQKASENVARSSAGNPFAWETLSTSISDRAIAMRRGVSIDMIAPHKRDQLMVLYRQAETAAGRSVTLDPVYGSGWIHLSITAAFAGDPETAESAYQYAVRYGADLYAAYSWALDMYSKKWYNNQSKQQLVAQAAASATFASDSETIQMSTDLRNANDAKYADALLAGAVATTQQAVTDDPRSGYTHWRLAAYYRAQGDLSHSVAEYRLAEKYTETRPDLCYATGLALDAAGRTKEAIVEYQKAITLDPEYQYAHSNLAQGLIRLGKLTEAETEIHRAIAIFPNSVEAYFDLANVRYRQGRFHDGDVEYRKTLALTAGAPDTYSRICWTLEGDGHYDASVKWMTEGIRLYPKNLSLMELMADIYIHKNEVKRSIGILTSVTAIDPSDGWAHEKLGEAYAITGDRGSARTEWRTAAALRNTAAAQTAKQMLTKYPE